MRLIIKCHTNYETQGAQRISPFPPVEELIKYCLKLLCDPKDEERHFVTFQDDDSVVLVVNNYGGMSNLELGALTDETITQLGKTLEPSAHDSDLLKGFHSINLEAQTR